MPSKEEKIDVVISNSVAASDVPNDITSVVADDGGSSNPEKQISKESREIKSLFEESYMKMDEKFIEYLDVFTNAMKKSEEAKTSLKKHFFWVIMGILMLIVISLCFVCIVAVIKGVNDPKTVVAIGGMLIESAAAIWVLPKIIAKYLFNKKEEKHRMKIIQSMQDYNDHKKKEKQEL
ncbi:hypothetical protein SAMN02910275_02450 [Butyrivibrio sp. INlla18]|uniref:hypothetical protein n=1 Tax=Butyrivibrio sp. INlla18 TaxID=1520806 RepID=UPI000891DDF2|nr:hypothetical protein [Butyrivibrio sp. INlla18]SDA73152.1 hypothetical protein SAMN02910275_02450 [Butyrivibrio sp. INlla18]